MPITVGGLNVMAANMAGSNVSMDFMAVGDDATAYASGNTTLANETKRTSVIFRDVSTPKAVIYNAAFTPTEVSGLVVKEVGTFTTGNTMINREVLTGSFVFDGLSEFQIQQTIRFNISGL
jgi:hypothetical protein